MAFGPKKQRKDSGSALVVALILLVVMTMLGVQGMRGNVMQERMAGNMRERNSAFQAAEAALREGERQLNTGVVVENSGLIVVIFDNSLAQHPAFEIVEKRQFIDDRTGLPDLIWCPHVVTASGFGAQADSVVIVESHFRPPGTLCDSN